MKTYIHIILDERRIKSDGTYPISYRIIHHSNPTTINSGYSVAKKNWDDRGWVKGKPNNIPDVAGVNAWLKQREAEMLKELIKLNQGDTLDSMPLKQLKWHLINKGKQKGKDITFVPYINEIINEFKENGKYNTAGSYQLALKLVLKNNNQRDLPFAKITIDFLKKIETNYMAVKDNHYNGLSVYLRSLRAVFNRAINDGVISSELYPFRRNASQTNKYVIKEEKTNKRAVKKEVIVLLESYEPPDGRTHQQLLLAKHIFLFSFYMRGMNMKDIALLRKKDITFDRISYRRAKTSTTPAQIKINDKAMAILEHYGLRDKLKNDFLFPIITRPGISELEYLDIRNKTKTINKYLNLIAADLNLPIRLTTYVSRHSWASIAVSTGVDRRIISKGLGHTNLSTTEIYIDDLISQDNLDDADDLITG